MSDLDPDKPSPRITVSEEKLRAILAEFKLELVEEFAKKASQRALERLENRITDIVEKLDGRLVALEGWKTAREAINSERKQASASRMALLSIASGLAGSLITLVGFHFGS